MNNISNEIFNDDIICVELSKQNNSYILPFNSSTISKNLYVELDGELKYIESFYNFETIKKYLETDNDATIFIYESISNESQHSDLHYLFQRSELIDKENKYFSYKDGNIILPSFDKNKNYSLVIFDIKSTCNNVRDEDFTFGLNWLDFVEQRINEDIIKSSKEKIDEWFDNGKSLKDKSVIDIGCGTGLHSFNMKRYCKKITSVDVDENCIKATNLLIDKFATKYDINKNEFDVKWGSVLDNSFMNNLGKFDVVYSWGVLHHTGHMWDAINNASKRCNKNGIFLVSLYSVYWRYEKTLAYKIKFNKANKFQKIKMIAERVMLAKMRQNKSIGWNKLTSRGMNVYNDVVDWLGGYPYEIATTDQMVKFMTDRKFELIRKQDEKNRAVHEWMFKKL